MTRYEVLSAYIQYRCIVGSQAYALETKKSDIDRRGFYLPPAHISWSLDWVPENIIPPNTTVCYWEIKRFIELALASNPNVLECLYTPCVEHSSPVAQDLLSIKSIFLSKAVYSTYKGYAVSQLNKVEKGFTRTGEYDWKSVMHLIRFLKAGIAILRDGYVPVRVEHDRDELLAIRNGLRPWHEIEQLRQDLFQQLDIAMQTSDLPDNPDRDRANRFLIDARRSAI